MATDMADARMAAPAGARGSEPWRQRSDAGAAAGRHRVPDPGRERAAGLRLAGAVRALDGRLRVRHLRLCLDLGAVDRAGARSRARHRGAALRSGISRAQAFRSSARLSVRQPRRGGWRRNAGRCLLRLLQPWLDDYTVIPLYLACAALPAYALSNVQDGISRSYDWVALGIVPTYIVRQLLLTAFMATAYLAGLPLDAITAMVLAGLALWLPPLGQLVILRRRLAALIEAGPRSYDFKLWIGTALPILLAEGFYLLLAHTDVLMLQQYRPPDEGAVYYAAAKTLAFVSFIGVSIAATTAHRCAAYQAAGDTQGLHDFLAKVIRFTFWPSLAVTLLLLAFGRPLLSLFGPGFGGGHHLMFIMAVGLVARAAIGPMERFLNMLGQQRACALVYASAFGINVALCLILIPHFGAIGAAIAIATALVVETLSLALVARHKLGFNVFIWGRRA